MSEPLTPKQQAVLKAIQVFIAYHGYAPTRRELAVELQIVSTNAVTDHLIALEKKGAIKVTPKVSRGIVVLP